MSRHRRELTRVVFIAAIGSIGLASAFAEMASTYPSALKSHSLGTKNNGLVTNADGSTTTYVDAYWGERPISMATSSCRRSRGNPEPGGLHANPKPTVDRQRPHDALLYAVRLGVGR